MSTNSYIGKELGSYRVVTKIASGGFASVFEGRHLFLTDRIVAIKILHTHLDPEKEGDLFRQEAQLLEKLKHPSILPIFDFGFNESLPYLVTEYASNGSLRDRLKQQASSMLPLEESQTILTQIGQALQHAHQQNIVHRDLKPENILFNAKNEALLADFGIATVLSTVNKNSLSIRGTPAYMAPEQFQGTVSRKSDQYALGCIAYELFTGQKPFTAPDFYSMAFKHMREVPPAPRQLNANLGVHVEQAILKAMAKRPGDRHADISAFVTALRTPDISHTHGPAKNVPISEKSNKQSPDFKEQLNAANVDENATPHIPLDIPPYVRQAVTTLDSAMSTARKEAIESLAQTEHPAAQEALVQALQHPIKDVRDNAASALEHTTHPAAQEPLVKALQHPIKDVRDNAAIALAHFNDLRALPHLIEIMTGADSHIRSRASSAMGRLGDEVVPILLKALHAESKDIRHVAAEALANRLKLGYYNAFYLQDEKLRTVIVPIVSGLLKALHDHDAEPSFTFSVIRNTLSNLLLVLKDSDLKVRRRSAWALSTALSGLLPTLQDSDLKVRRHSAWALSTALPGLLPTLQDSDVEVRNITARTIDTMMPIIHKARKDKDEYVRSSINWTLKQIRKFSMSKSITLLCMLIRILVLIEIGIFAICGFTQTGPFSRSPGTSDIILNMVFAFSLLIAYGGSLINTSRLHRVGWFLAVLIGWGLPIYIFFGPLREKEPGQPPYPPAS